MNARNEIVFEEIREDREYRMSMTAGCPLGESYEVACLFVDKLIGLINEHAEKRPNIEDKPEEVKEEAK